MLEGLAQDFQLTLPYVLRRAEQLYGYREIVTRRPDKSFHRHTFSDFVSRSKKLAVALGELGLESGDRVGTLGWNTYQHLEAYFGVPSSGLVLHTLNPRLHEDDLAYIANHAEDRVMLVDETLVSVFEKFREKTDVEHAVIVTEGDEVPDGMISYEGLLSGADEDAFEYPDFDEKQAAALCYTSGTTGRPKGALYSHRSTVLHSMMAAMGNTFALSEGDCVLPVVPMFHVNAWGLPFASVLVGAKLMMPGPHLDPESLLEELEQEAVTLTAGVPTVFLALLQALDAEPERYDLSRLRAMVIGGSAVPKGVIRSYHDKHHRERGQPDYKDKGTPRRGATGLQGQAGLSRAVRGGTRPRRRGLRAVERRDDGRARGKGALGREDLLRGARGRRQVHRRRLVQDRGHRHHRPLRVH
jgi:fatty-acyl-CoA synthase